MKQLDADQFLAEHWQKQPLFLAGALPPSLPSLAADELAWLATLPDVESRLVVTERDGDRPGYRLENGPFDEKALRSLPPEDWTLLVQDVDKHLPDFRDWFATVDFIPDWRIDDLMVSLAAPGGSVGPHLDNYDVFLCQGQGSRDWRTGDPSRARVDASAEDLALLRPFDIANRYKARDGDVLYLPPGIPHWGIAQDLCVTYSIGMRAPTRQELQVGSARVLDTDQQDSDKQLADLFYADPDLCAAEAQAGCISAEAVARVRSQGLLDVSLTDAAMARVLGCVVTDPKAWLMPEALEAPSIEQPPTQCRVHGMARLAWFEAGDERLVFVNGAYRNVDARGLLLARHLCANRDNQGIDLDEYWAEAGSRELLQWMFKEGLFDAGHSTE